MMLGGKDGIFHACGLCLTRPFLRIEQIGIKVFEIEVVLVLRDLFAGFDPFMAGRKGVQAEMDEHAESVVGEPGGIAGCFAGSIACHGSFLLFCAVCYLLLL